jgi:hypothetical protein
MIRKIVIAVMLLIYVTNIVVAVEEPPIDLQQLETKTLIIEQNAKATAELKEYFERKTIDYNKNTQRMIDENFKVLDKRQDEFLREAGFKMGAIFFSGIVAGQLIVLLIRRKLDKRAIVKKNLWDYRHNENIVVPLPKTDEEEEIQRPTKPNVKETTKKDVKQTTKNTLAPIKEDLLPIKNISKMIVPSMRDSK